MINTDNLQIGDIVLVKNTDWISRAIAWSFHVKSELSWKLNAMPSNHTGIVSMSKYNELGIWEQHEEFHFTPFRKYIQRVERNETEVIFARINGGLGFAEQFEVTNLCYAFEGLKYDYLSYISHIWRVLLRLPDIKIIECKSKYYCTEAVFQILETATGIDLSVTNPLPTPYTVEKRIMQGRLNIIKQWTN